MFVGILQNYSKVGNEGIVSCVVVGAHNCSQNEEYYDRQNSPQKNALDTCNIIKNDLTKCSATRFL